MAGSPRSPRLYSVLSQGRLLRFKKNESVFSSDEDTDVMLVVKGYVKRYTISNTGALGVQIIYGPQDFFSLSKVFAQLLDQRVYDGPEVFYYKTVTDAQIYAVDAKSFAEAVAKDPSLYKELFSEAGHHLTTCIHSIENISLGNAYARVAHEILFAAQHFGVKMTVHGGRLLLPLTHQDIADGLGLTRETVTKAVVKLREKGIISPTRSFAVREFKALEAAAYQ